MVQVLEKDGLKCVLMECGELCVIIPGVLMIPVSSADNLDSQKNVNAISVSQ